MIWNLENMQPKGYMMFQCINKHKTPIGDLLFDEKIREARCPICKEIIRFDGYINNDLKEKGNQEKEEVMQLLNKIPSRLHIDF